MTNSIYAKLSTETLSRIRKIDNISEFQLNDIRKGIISFHANWSGQSILNGRSILGLINDSLPSDFEIIVINIDSISQEKQFDLLGFVSHGYFESAWVENGNIEFLYNVRRNENELKRFKLFLNSKVKTENH